MAGLCFSFQLFLVVAVKMEGVESECGAPTLQTHNMHNHHCLIGFFFCCFLMMTIVYNIQYKSIQQYWLFCWVAVAARVGSSSSSSSCTCVRSCSYSWLVLLLLILILLILVFVVLVPLALVHCSCSCSCYCSRWSVANVIRFDSAVSVNYVFVNKSQNMKLATKSKWINNNI